MNQILHRVDSLINYVHPKTGNHLRSHLRAIMALDHRRLIRPGKKIRPNFLRSTSLLYKILPTNLGEWKPTFLPFVHHIWGETVLWGTVFIRQTSDRMHYFTIFQYKVHSLRTMEVRVGFELINRLKNFQNHLYSHPVLTFVVRAVASVWMNINKVTLQHNKEFFMFIFYLMV